MGSKRKRVEKKKDFVKPKLKVGKTAAKPDNYTDTSFKARSIALPHQTISKKAGGDENHEFDVLHYLSLTRHHSASTRREVLLLIEKNLPSNPTLYKEILTRTIPLIVDQSQEVCQALVSLLGAVGRAQGGLLDLHLGTIVAFINLAMSHIQPGVRNNSTKFVKILVECCGKALVRSYFAKILKSYFTLLSWPLKNDKKSVSLAVTTSSTIGGSSKKARVGHLSVLKGFLAAALLEDEILDGDNQNSSTKITAIHPLTHTYLLPATTQPYGALKLFVKIGPSLLRHDDNDGATAATGGDDSSFTMKDLDTITTEDLDTRRKVLHDVFLQPMTKNLNDLIKEGGEVGREAHHCMNVLLSLETINKSEST